MSAYLFREILRNMQPYIVGVAADVARSVSSETGAGLIEDKAPGLTWGSILLMPVNSTLVRRYEPTSAGAGVANGSMNSHEIAWFPPGTYYLDGIWPADIAIASMGGYTRIVGKQIFLGDAYLDGVVFSDAEESAGVVSVIEGPPAGCVLIPNTCTIECRNTGAGASHAIVDNGGKILVWGSVVQGIAASGEGYSVYKNSGIVRLYHSGVYGSTDWFNSPDVETYCVTEMPPEEEPAQVYTYYANVIQIASTSNLVPNSFFVPWAANPGLTPAGASLVTSGAGLRGFVARGNYLYYASTTTGARGVHRYDLGTDTDDVEVTGSGDLYRTSFAVLDDDNVIVQTAAMINDGSLPDDYRIRWEKVNFATSVRTIIADLPEYADPDNFYELNYYLWVLHDGKLVIGGVLEDSPNRTYKFYVYDVDTGAQLFHDAGTSEATNANLQVPVTPPVVVGGKVFFVYNTGLIDQLGTEDTVRVYEVDIDTGDVRAARPERDGRNLFLYQGAYDAASGQIAFLARDALSVSDDHVSVGLMDLSDLSFTYPLTIPDDGSGAVPGVMIRSNTTAYMIRNDGNVYALTDFVNPVTAVPALTSWQALDRPQPNKICNVVDDDGYIWVSDGGDIYKYPAAGGAATQIVTAIPDPGAGGSSPIQQLYLTDGKLFVVNRNTNSSTVSIYQVE